MFQAKDRTGEVRAAIQAYSDPLTKFEIDFIPLRLEDAFDGAWWKSVGMEDLNHAVGIDINDDCESCYYSNRSSAHTP